MKKIIFTILFLISSSYGANLYFDAFQDIQKAKRMLKTNPDKANSLFIEAAGYLKQVINTSINNNKPSGNAFFLLGEMYYNGWGVKKNTKKAYKLFCAAKQLGNFKANTKVNKLKIKCKAIKNFKELQQWKCH